MLKLRDSNPSSLRKHLADQDCPVQRIHALKELQAQVVIDIRSESQVRTTCWAYGVFWPSRKAPSHAPRKKILRCCLIS